MITNANRSGSVRVEPGEEDRRDKPQDDRRSGRISDKPSKDKKRTFGLARRQRIRTVNGRLELEDI
jgi:hypothetical protein